MNKSIIFWLVVIVLIFPVSTYLMASLHLKEFAFIKNIYGTHIDAWISFFGNYLGGILGGIIAYLIANHQIKIQNQQNKANVEKEIEEVKNLIIFTYFNEIKETLNTINLQIKEQQKAGGSYILDFPIINIPYVQEYMIYINKLKKEQAFGIISVFSNIRYLISLQKTLLDAKEKWNEVYYYSNIFVRMFECYQIDKVSKQEINISQDINDNIIGDTYKARTKKALEFFALSELTIKKIEETQSKYLSVT